MAKRNLLLCFDAFGTLFRIKAPVERQYGDVARRRFGLSGFTDDQLRTAFRAAFKDEAARHPNYGRASRMGATQWWTNVIHATFRPLLAGEDVPAGLAPHLLDRFASAAGYTAAPQLPQLLQALQSRPLPFYDRIVVGVITNSDDRVPGILTSLGLRVSPLRYGGCHAPTAGVAAAAGTHDIDFHCMSYDVGAEKPDPRIFRAAESLLPAALAARGDSAAPLDGEPRAWDKLYVGDEVRKDIGGAAAAGWYPALLLDATARRQLAQQEGAGEERLLRDLQRLEACAPQPLPQLFAQHPAVAVDSIASLVGWLAGHPFRP